MDSTIKLGNLFYNEAVNNNYYDDRIRVELLKKSINEYLSAMNSRSITSPVKCKINYNLSKSYLKMFQYSSNKLSDLIDRCIMYLVQTIDLNCISKDAFINTKIEELTQSLIYAINCASFSDEISTLTNFINLLPNKPEFSMLVSPILDLFCFKVLTQLNSHLKSSNLQQAMQILEIVNGLLTTNYKNQTEFSLKLHDIYQHYTTLINAKDFLLQGEKLYTTLIQNKSAQESFWEAVDLFKAALQEIKKIKHPFEGLIYFWLGKVYLTMGLKSASKEYFKKSIENASQYNDEETVEWLTSAKEFLLQLNEEEENAKIPEENMKDDKKNVVSALYKAYETLSKEDFLIYLLEEYPPKTPAKMQINENTFKNKTNIRKFILLYHPDKHMDADDFWKFMSTEITKILYKIYNEVF